VPGRRHAEPEQGVQVPLLVNDDAHIPVAANGNNPALGGLGRRVRDGDEVDVLVVVGELGELLEGLFGNCGRGGNSALATDACKLKNVSRKYGVPWGREDTSKQKSMLAACDGERKREGKGR
jgi:hypothetical protein